eukprot:4316649-Pyramimonas_sp.AAC.1
MEAATTTKDDGEVQVDVAAQTDAAHPIGVNFLHCEPGARRSARSGSAAAGRRSKRDHIDHLLGALTSAGTSPFHLGAPVDHQSGHRRHPDGYLGGQVAHDVGPDRR